MKELRFIFFAITVITLTSCQRKHLKITFESDKKDTATALGATQVYILKKVTENSDFNYRKLANIDNHIKNLRQVFEPVSGTFTYYQFLSTFVGESFNYDGPPLLENGHNILIIKTNSENKIVDAYQYTLEWGEIPLQYDVFKSSAKNITLTNNLNISELKFIRTYSWSTDNKQLKENGIIKLL